mmetsp:Transcript_8625/g.19805  ORF Transcript_8625/g.19805 Transcript_8625/m.19805 type:complete len:209 (+) Transcript_8625:1425-2051(+)
MFGCLETTNMEWNAANIDDPSWASAPSSISMVWMPSITEALSKVRTSSLQVGLAHSKPAELPSKRTLVTIVECMSRSNFSLALTCPLQQSQSATLPCTGETEITTGGNISTGLGTSSMAQKAGRSKVIMPPGPTVRLRALTSATASLSTVVLGHCVVMETLVTTASRKLATTRKTPLLLHPRVKMRTPSTFCVGVSTTSHWAWPKEPR